MGSLLKNSDLVECWLSAPPNNKISVLKKFVERNIGKRNLEKLYIHQKVYIFNSQMSTYWKASKYNRSVFEKKHSKWLNWLFFNTDNQPSTSEICRKNLDEEKNRNTAPIAEEQQAEAEEQHQVEATSADTTNIEMDPRTTINTTSIEATPVTVETEAMQATTSTQKKQVRKYSRSSPTI